VRLWLVAACSALVLPVVPATADATYRQGSVYARVTDAEVVLGNSVAERRWSRDALRTTALVDKRGHDRVVSAGSRDFALLVGPAEVGSESFAVSSVAVTSLPRGIYGNVPKSAISGPGVSKSDIAVSRLFTIPGQQAMRLQFRGELFNAFNQTNFAAPVTNASATNFGQITATRDGDPGRVGQIAIKLLW